MKALFIIDMQKGSFSPASSRHDADGVIERINDLAKIFRTNEDKVFIIQHDGTKEGCFIPHTEEWEIIDSLIIDPTDIVISKKANDAFYNTSLKNLLVQYGINDLIITGCATDFCVDATIKSALINDFNIVVIADAHSTANRPNIKREEVIKYFNWLWSELTPTNGKIQVMDKNKYLEGRLSYL